MLNTFLVYLRNIENCKEEIRQKRKVKINEEIEILEIGVINGVTGRCTQNKMNFCSKVIITDNKLFVL